MELYYSLRPAELRRSTRRRRVVLVTARGSGLQALAGALIGAVIGTVLAPFAGTLFGLVLGAAAGLLVGVPAAMTLALATRSYRGRGRTRFVGALASVGWGAVLVAVIGAAGGGIGSEVDGGIGAANYAALSAVALLMFATIGASVAPVAVGADGPPADLDEFGPVVVPADRVRPIRSFDTA